LTCGRSSRTPSIDEVRSRFERWRQIRQGETAIPEELWSAAVARRDGVIPRRASHHPQILLSQPRGLFAFGNASIASEHCHPCGKTLIQPQLA
jgi:hypothetical protein